MTIFIIILLISLISYIYFNTVKISKVPKEQPYNYTYQLLDLLLNRSLFSFPAIFKVQVLKKW